MPPTSRIATSLWWLIYAFLITTAHPLSLLVCLYRLINCKTLPELLSVLSDMNVSLVDDRPILKGILLSEIMLLGQRSFAKRLISLLNQFNNPELRRKLMCLC
nr:hypothetical protein [Providencia stuartii]